MFISKSEAITQMNRWGEVKTPFLFIINYLQSSIYLSKLIDMNSDQCLYVFPNQSNAKVDPSLFEQNNRADCRATPISFPQYQSVFNPMMNALESGEIDLINLTFPTPIELNCSLQSLFYQCNAKYRLWLKDHFTLFSPETFVTIQSGKITIYPMKGTIDATLPNAESELLNNPKEQTEHKIIVALAKAELSQIATEINVPRYRYIDHLESRRGSILQSSSQIEGKLPTNYRSKLGDILFNLLPAASITGAPKKNAIRLIDRYEPNSRGFYTGVAGIFDGTDLDSTVLIRIIEKHNQQLYFKSGGGITRDSHADDEYNELIQKIYLPLA